MSPGKTLTMGEIVLLKKGYRGFNRKTHIEMRVCKNIRNFPKPLKQFLERETKGSLEKIRLLFPDEEWPEDKEPPFYTYRLEGIPDYNTGNTKIGTRFRAIAPILFSAYPNSLLRVCKEVGWSDLVLDFSTESGIFEDFSEAGLQEALNLSPEELYQLQCSVNVLDILLPKKVFRRIRKNGNPN